MNTEIAPTYVNTYDTTGDPVVIEFAPGIGYAMVRFIHRPEGPLPMSAEELDQLARAATYAAAEVRKASA
jgi:hypothetical protein